MSESDDRDYFERLVDTEALAGFLEAELGPAEDYAVERHQQGHSNETLFVTWGDRELVVRRPPPGDTAETAHDVLREYRVIDALQETPVRVPPTVTACSDHSVIGSDFYVMDRLDGDVLRDAEPDRFADADNRRRIGEQLLDGLAEIHEIDPAAVGLDDFGHPEGFTQRQVKRWSEQLTWAFSRTAEQREVPVLYEVMEWLQEHAPDSHPHTLVHGDYKLDNVMFAPGTPPEIVGVFDWEMSTLGDPLTDLGWLLSFWWEPDDPEPPVQIGAGFVRHEDYPSRQALVERYENETGITYEDDRFYRTLAVYKLAGLGEMFYRRYLEGNSDDPLYEQMDEGVPALAERAKRIIDGEEPL